MKKFLIIITTLCICILNLLPTLAIEDNKINDVYTSYRQLSEEEMTEKFLQGYKKIICYDQSRSSGTHTVTVCTSMKKRNYGWIGYSKKCFHETYTAVTFTSGSSSISCSIGGISVSIPVSNAVDAGSASGSISLTEAEKSKVDAGTHYSCIRYKGYLTKASYTSYIYDNATGALLNTTSFNSTYTFKSNKSSGLDYYHEVRTPSELNQIKNNNYVGTNSEKNAINSVNWVTISNPNTANIVPDDNDFD